MEVVLTGGVSLTAASRHEFSLRAPTHPVKPMMNVMAPATMRMKAGSSAMFVSLLRLLKVSFSVQAQMPTAMIPSPVSCDENKTLVTHPATGVINETHPEYDIESENYILEATANLAMIPAILTNRHFDTGKKGEIANGAKCVCKIIFFKFTNNKKSLIN